MQNANLFRHENRPALADGPGRFKAVHVDTDSPHRGEAESFIRGVFWQRHTAHIRAFAPNLMLVQENARVIAAAGWRGAEQGALFLECYLDEPIDIVMEKIVGQPLARSCLAEVGHLASDKPGSSLQIFRALARHLHQFGYEWVVFTATQELIGIFTKLGLPLLALAKADPARLGENIKDWGHYYDTRPVVVAGRIRLALEKIRYAG
jgi:hypothetical protein